MKLWNHHKPFNEPSNLGGWFFDILIIPWLIVAIFSEFRRIQVLRDYCQRHGQGGLQGEGSLDETWWKGWKWVERCWGWSKLDINWTSFDYVLTLRPWVDLSGRQWSFAIYTRIIQESTLAVFRGQICIQDPITDKGKASKKGRLTVQMLICTFLSSKVVWEMTQMDGSRSLRVRFLEFRLPRW